MERRELTPQAIKRLWLMAPGRGMNVDLDNNHVIKGSEVGIKAKVSLEIIKGHFARKILIILMEASSQGAMVRDPLSKEDIRDMVAAGLVCSLGASNNPRNGEGDQLRDSTKLMLDAFKSVPKSPAGDGSVLPVQGTGTSSKTRKALLFEDSGPDGPAAAQVNGIDMKEESKVAGESADSGEVLELSDENLHSQALHEANLMIEGVLLSDSELLVEEDENIEEWEQGEITDFMEEEELAAGVQELGDNIDMAVIQDGAEAQVDVEAQMNDEDEEAAKKKEAKSG
ncbi:hypothetical protein YC2023_042837 [Brassica napus]